jgi:hypothetical protein
MANFVQRVLYSKYFGSLEIFHESAIFRGFVVLFIENTHQNNNYYKLVNRINYRIDDNKKYYMKIKEEKLKYKQKIKK